MPYNTRRKSISLSSLGIQIPNATRLHRANSKPTVSDEPSQMPPAKKQKRSHPDDAPLSPISTPRSPARSPPAQSVLPPPSQRIKLEHTPPPSPGDVEIARKVDTEGINDDIVIAVIEQLEKTANRPHLIKELATVLASTNQNIAHSANPAALLSSRLSLYLKRPWTALSPCPLAKELIPVHPRKVFFFLTTQKRGSLPQNSDDIIPPVLNDLKRLTPSVSDPSVADDSDVEMRARSLSPEVEFFSPDFDDDNCIPTPLSPGEPFSGRSSLNPDGTPDVRSQRSNRAPSPALEADERGFTETATAVRARGMSLQSAAPQPSVEIDTSAATEEEETPEQQQNRDHNLLFGNARLNAEQQQKLAGSSPVIPAKLESMAKTHPVLNLEDLTMYDAPDDNLVSPEMVDVDELESMFSGY